MSQNTNNNNTVEQVPEPEILEPSIAHPPLPSDNEEVVLNPIPIEEAPTEVFNESDEDFVEELIDGMTDDDSDSMHELNEFSDNDSDDNDSDDNDEFEQEEKVPEEKQEEKQEEKEESTENKHDSYECAVCYKTLTMDTNVVTKCDHHFCKTCFYRWIQTNASCPLCRSLIDSNAHLSPDQLEMALSTEYAYYMHVLEKANNLQGKHIRLTKKHYKLKMDTDQLLTRQITLNRLIDQTAAITNAMVAAREHCINNDSGKLETFAKNYRRHKLPHLSNAFYGAFSEEKERIQEFVDESPDIVKLAPKKRKRISQKNIKIKIINTETDEEGGTAEGASAKESHSSKKSKLKSSPTQPKNEEFEFGPPTGTISFNFGEDDNFDAEPVIGGPICI